MAHKALPLPFIRLLLLAFFFSSGEILKLANGQEESWCVAKPSSSEAELAADLHFSGDQVQGSCKIIQEDGYDSCQYA